MNKSENIGQLSAALAKAQGQIKGAVRDSNNPFFKSKYADLASVWEACREALTKNDLCVVQTCRSTFDEHGEHLFVDTILAHKSGEWISDSCECPVAKPDAQGYGSAITYMRRYALAAFTGVAPLDDDDGEAAVGRSGGVQAAPERKARQPKVKASKAAAPPDDSPQHVALVRQELNSYCIKTSDASGDPLTEVRARVWAALQSQFEITSLNDLSEKTASAIIDWLNAQEMLTNG